MVCFSASKHFTNYEFKIVAVISLGLHQNILRPFAVLT
uniref:Uncharacterized protein n=1 Tax=Arundo donax TaxID=35708 RepID=A0A0A8YUD8_ARUDO